VVQVNQIFRNRLHFHHQNHDDEVGIWNTCLPESTDVAFSTRRL